MTSAAEYWWPFVGEDCYEWRRDKVKGVFGKVRS